MKLTATFLGLMIALASSYRLASRAPALSTWRGACKVAKFHSSRCSLSGSPAAATPTVQLIEAGVQQAVSRAYTDLLGEKGVDAMIFLGKAEFGDYQCNVAMPLAKTLKLKPRDIAEQVMARVLAENAGLVERMDISGPGFINIHLSNAYIKSKLWAMLELGKGVGAEGSVRLGIGRVSEAQRQRMVVDFSSPNIAKEMHVGHLRSTIIGDSLSRVLEFLGHDVLRLNHVGDWGTQFGMLITYLKQNFPEAMQAGGADGEGELEVEIADLVEFYKAAKKCFDADTDFQDASRKEVVALQAGQAESLRAWRTICQKSRVEFQKIYDMLGVQLEERGESFYNPLLPGLVQGLQGSGKVVNSEGAQCIFLDGYKNSDGTPLPLIVQKSDGGYLYATTDLAALQHRVQAEGAQRIIYVTDQGQSQHFEMVFRAAREAGILTEGVRVTHVPFGLVLGEDGKKIKSRAGDSVKLRELLDEAVRIAEENERERNRAKEGEGAGGAGSVSGGLDESARERARVVGIAAVKYADLAMNRESNYRFSFDKMLSLSGNTAPYMLYAYVRILGIQRRAAEELLGQSSSPTESSSPTKGSGSAGSVAARQELLSRLASADGIVLEAPAERVLALHLIRFHEMLLDVSNGLYPSKMCDYIFELSQKFNQFYEHCPVIKADSPQLQVSRAALCALTAG
ncbi:tRNA synthetases class I (R)-domain-containing protein, partial [Ochromonadaceae sp. CCMP2298]